MIFAIYGLAGPDDYYMGERMRKAPLDDDLAYAIAEFAKVDIELKTVKNDWLIKKTEMLGFMRKRQIDFHLVASDELDLLSLEREIDQLNASLINARDEIWKNYHRASDNMKQPR
jgi:hypothetical protein